MSDPYPLIQLLDRLNRKERFFLVAEALGKPVFEPDAGFLAKVGHSIIVDVPDPACVQPIQWRANGQHVKISVR